MCQADRARPLNARAEHGGGTRASRRGIQTRRESGTTAVDDTQAKRVRRKSTQKETFVNPHGRCACSGCPRRTDGAPKRSRWQCSRRRAFASPRTLQKQRSPPLNATVWVCRTCPRAASRTVRMAVHQSKQGGNVDGVCTACKCWALKRSCYKCV